MSTTVPPSQDPSTIPAAAGDPAQRDSGDSKVAHHRAARRVLELIETVAASDRALNLSELAHNLELPKSTAHALVHTLTADGFLERNGDARYTLGPRLLRLLGGLPHQFELPRIARPVMQELVDEVGETALVGVSRRRQILYVEQVEAPHPIRYVAPLGEPRPLHCTSVGKLFLAYMPEGELREFVSATPLEAFTAYTKTDIGEVLAEARTIRDHGYSLNREESIPGVTALAAGIRERGQDDAPLFAGLSVVGPSERMAPKLHRAKELVPKAATSIALGIHTR